MFIIFKKFNLLIKEVKHLFGIFTYEHSANMWDSVYGHLSDYNKTILNLSSSALILSFTAIQIGKFKVDKVSIILTWALFLLVIICNVSILFLNFLYRLTSKILKYKVEQKVYKSKNDLYTSIELKFFMKSRVFSMYLLILELDFFVFGFISLIYTAIKLL